MDATQARTETEAFVVEAFTETFLGGDPDAVADFFASDLDYLRSSGEGATRNDLSEDVEMFHTAFPDLHGEIVRIMSEDDKVSFLYKIHGTHEGVFEGIPPTHEEMSAKGAAMARVEDGAITSYRIVFDNLGMLEDLGVLGQ